MEVTPEQLTEFFLQPAVLGLGIGLIVLLVLLHGWSMKWSLHLVGGGPVGFFWASTIAFFVSVTAGFTQGFFTSFFEAGPLVSTCYAVAAAILTITVMARCGPIRAVLAYLVYGLLSTLGGVTVAAFFALLAFLAVQEELIHVPPELSTAVAESGSPSVWEQLPSPTDGTELTWQSTPARTSSAGAATAADPPQQIAPSPVVTGPAVQTNPFAER